MLDHKNIKILKTINSYKNISKAAKDLYTAQPNLSRALKNIENNFEFEIFDRKNSPMKLTKEGEILFKYINKFENLEKNMFQEIRAIPKINPNLRIGALSFISQYMIPNIIPEFINMNPNFEIILKKYDSMTFQKALLKNDIDLFITNRSINNKNLLSKFVINDPIYLMYPKNNLDNKNELSDFYESTFYLLHPGKNMRKSTDEIFNNHKFYPKNIKTVSNIMNGVSLVRANKGVTFVYETSLKMINSFDYCNFLRIDGDYAEITIAYIDPYLEKIVDDLTDIIKYFIISNSYL